MTEPKETVVYREPTVEQIQAMLDVLEGRFYAERRHLKAWLRSAKDRAEGKQPTLPGI
ncbi:MAG: hypothetical protein V1755_06635 [Chloroflexota bacterium]